jgi:hypothetical protein
MSDETNNEPSSQPQGAAASAPDTANADTKVKTVKVRVIADQGDYVINDVLSLKADDAAAAVAAGWADDHPSAVKYAERLKKAADANAAD